MSNPANEDNTTSLRYYVMKCMWACNACRAWDKVHEKSHTHTYQLKHVFIFWHNGELQHALTARHIKEGGRGEDRENKDIEVKNYKIVSSHPITWTGALIWSTKIATLHEVDRANLHQIHFLTPRSLKYVKEKCFCSHSHSIFSTTVIPSPNEFHAGRCTDKKSTCIRLADPSSRYLNFYWERKSWIVHR